MKLHAVRKQLFLRFEVFIQIGSQVAARGFPRALGVRVESVSESEGFDVLAEVRPLGDMSVLGPEYGYERNGRLYVGTLERDREGAPVERVFAYGEGGSNVEPGSGDPPALLQGDDLFGSLYGTFGNASLETSPVGSKNTASGA